MKIWIAQSMSGVVRKTMFTAASVMSTTTDPTMRATVRADTPEKLSIAHYLGLIVEMRFYLDE